jgi:phage replication O-like protein O
MANVQAEHGFTKIANELLEVVMQQKFNGTQFKLIMAVWRFTYGFNRKEHELSLSFLSKATGIHKQQVKTELAKLIEQNVIKVTSESTYTASRKLSFNKDHDKWKDLQEVKQHTVSESSTTTVSEDTYTTVSELTTTTVSESTYQERKDKENIKENINKGFEEFWILYPRKVKKQDAMNRYKTQVKNQKVHERIIEGLKLYLKEIERDGTQEKYIMHPSTFLNQKKYLDETEEQDKPSQSIVSQIDPVLLGKLKRINELMDKMNITDDDKEFKKLEEECTRLRKEVS